MTGGFSFCGVDVAMFGLEYVPTLNQTYVFSSSSYDVHQEVFDAHNGGYFYGTTVQPKDFALRCFYQNRHVAHGALAEIENFFRRGKTGRLVFEQRDWVWYTATVVNVDVSDLRNYQNGFVTIYLRAYYPFSRHDYISICNENMMSNYITANSGLLPEGITPPVLFENVTQSTSFMLYNGGSERASVAVSIAGEAGEGVVITNQTTGQKTRFVAFTKALTSDAGKYIVSDGLNGKTVITDGVSPIPGFLYHDHGFIELDPSFPIQRDIYLSYTKGSSAATIIGPDVGFDAVGRYVRLAGQWLKIADAQPGSLIFDHVFEENGSDYTNLVSMNEISVELTAGAELTKLQFIYKPTFQ